MLHNLTTRQEAIYRYLEDFLRLHGYVPSVRETAAAFGIRSTNGVQCHLRALERKGYLIRQPGKARALTLNPAALARGSSERASPPRRS